MSYQHDHEILSRSAAGLGRRFEGTFATETVERLLHESYDLLAATFATVAVAIPMLLVASSWETFVWPRLLEQASPIAGF